MILFTNTVITSSEIALNVAGSIPIVAIFSSSLRFLAGKVQFVAGAILAICAFTAYSITKDSFYLHGTYAGLEHLSHGALHVVWSIVEFVLALTIIGSLFVLIGELCRESKHQFTPLFPYSGCEIRTTY